MNIAEILSTVEENEKYNNSLNNNIKSAESEECVS